MSKFIKYYLLTLVMARVSILCVCLCFEHITRNCFVTLYKSLVRSNLEYANSVWYPKRKMDVDKLEHVQKRATKLIPELSKKSYSDRLKALKLPTLKYRRYRGDMIELFKIIKGIFDPHVSHTLNIWN